MHSKLPTIAAFLGHLELGALVKYEVQLAVLAIRIPCNLHLAEHDFRPILRPACDHH